MSNQLSVFQFQSSYDVRIQLINNEPWFCLKDVCGVLDIKNVSQLASQLDIKGISKTYTHTNGGKQELIFVNEPNLYRVIFRSNKPEAKQFQDWVFNEVLPAIRKTGSYSLSSSSLEAEHSKNIGNFSVPDEILANVFYILRWASQMRLAFKKISPAMYNLGSKYAPEIYDFGNELDYHFNLCKEHFLPLLKTMKDNELKNKAKQDLAKIL